MFDDNSNSIYFVYAITLSGYVDGGCPNTCLYDFFEDEQRAIKVCEDLNKKYPTEDDKFKWLDKREKEGIDDIDGFLHGIDGKFYITKVRVIKKR